MMPSYLSTGTESALRRLEQKRRDTALLRLAAETQWLEHGDRMLGLAEANRLVRELSLACQSQCQAKIGSVVTRCLESVFGESKYTFHLVFEEKRNQTEARCILRDAAGNEYDPTSDSGGGVLDIVAFGLRLACLMLIKPRPAKVLILDEPFRFLSKDYRAPLTQTLDALCSEFGLQIIMVTHFTEFHLGNVIEI